MIVYVCETCGLAGVGWLHDAAHEGHVVTAIRGEDPDVWVVAQRHADLQVRIKYGDLRFVG